MNAFLMVSGIVCMVADLARALGEPYTTVREWVVYGRLPSVTQDLDRRISAAEELPE